MNRLIFVDRQVLFYFTIVNPLINVGLQQIVVWNHVATGQYPIGPVQYDKEDIIARFISYRHRQQVLFQTSEN
jgi:hypothetical protein